MAARTKPDALTPEVLEQLNEATHRALLASFAGGVAVGVTDRRRTLAVLLLGHADIAAGSPLRPQTLFEIGSISKGFAAICVLQAQAEGLVDVHQPVTRALPWFSVRSWFEPIAPHHLMSHTGGIILGSDITDDALFEVWSLRDTQAGTPPGTYFHYSNVGYKALGLMLEAVEGRPFPEILRRRVLAPLGMRASEPAITHAVRHRLAVGYVPAYDDRPPRRSDGLAPAPWLESDAADGSICSSADDMARYLRLLLNGGRAPSGRLLSSADFEAMTTGVIDSDEELGGRYGYGIERLSMGGREYLAHTGGMVGYHSAMLLDPDAGLGVVVMGSGLGKWWELSIHVLATVRATLGGEPLPELELPVAAAEPEHEPDEEPPAQWRPLVGHYRARNPWLSNFHVRVRGGRLWMIHYGDEFAPAPLVPVGDGVFRIGDDERSPERLRFDVMVDGVAVRATYSGCPYYRTFTP
jgi:CubicO group peptidase (beta-lactamase class C family)